MSEAQTQNKDVQGAKGISKEQNYHCILDLTQKFHIWDSPQACEELISKCTILKVDFSIACKKFVLQVYMLSFQPRKFTGQGSDGVKDGLKRFPVSCKLF